MAQGPNPVELYEASIQQMLPIIAGVKSDQLSSPTSCSEWDVQALINHNLRVQAFVDTVLKGAPGDPGQLFAVADEPIPASRGYMTRPKVGLLPWGFESSKSMTRLNNLSSKCTPRSR